MKLTKAARIIIVATIAWVALLGLSQAVGAQQLDVLPEALTPMKPTVAPNTSVAQKVANLRKQLEDTDRKREESATHMLALEDLILARPNNDDVKVIVDRAIDSLKGELKVSGSAEARLEALEKKYQALEKAYEEEKAISRRAFFILAEETEYLSKRKMRTGLLNLGPREQLSYVTAGRIAELRKSLNSTASSTLASKKPPETDVQVALRPQ